MAFNLHTDEEADIDAVVKAVAARQKVDPEVARRVHERAASITEKIRTDHGTLNIAVDLIRDARK